MLVKFLDGGPVNGFRWFFYAGLSNVEIELTLRDLLTLERHSYVNGQGELTSFADTRVFRAGEGGGNLQEPLGVPLLDGPPSGLTKFGTLFEESTSLGLPPPGSPLLGVSGFGSPSEPAGTCSPGPATLCLLGGRFEVHLTREGPSGGGIPGIPAAAVPLTETAGAFWFFRSSNLEAVVKVLDGRAVNGHFWVFYGSATNLGFTVTVTDTVTGEIAIYEKAAGAPGSFADTDAFLDVL